MQESDASSISSNWDAFWHGTGDSGAFASGGVSHPAIAHFWSQFFRTVREGYEAPTIVDIATGNGALIEQALQVLGNETNAYTCVDVSAAAIENVQRRFPGATGIVADALSVPLDDQKFDIVTSQFGVEYAGNDAYSEAARLLAPGGQLALMLHIENGHIHNECVASLAAIERLQASGFVSLSIELFRTGFAAVRGADRASYDAAGAKLAPAIEAAEAIMAEYGEDVAGETIARLYGDVGEIHSKIANYDPDEVLGWLGTMDAELDAYKGRMTSMLSASVSHSAFDALRGDLIAAGLTLTTAAPLIAKDGDTPLAWVLVARR
ncbi:MAG: methyltransferase domain-containing protein [Woeseiaceae bacterium]